MLTLLLVSALVLLLRTLFGGVDLEQYVWMALFIIVLMPIIGFLFGLYQTLPLPPHRELRSLVLSASMVFALLLLFLFAGKSSISYSRLALLDSEIARALRCGLALPRAPSLGPPALVGRAAHHP